MDRREFLELSIKGISLASIASLNPFSVGSALANDELPWEQETFKYSLGNFKLQSGEILKDAFQLALKPRCGPVHVNLPRDVLSNNASFPKFVKHSNEILPKASNKDISKAIDIILQRSCNTFKKFPMSAN